MIKTRIWMILGFFVLVLSTSAQEQIKQKPGLWEMTTQITTTGDSTPQSPLPPEPFHSDAQMPQMPEFPQTARSGEPHSKKVCVTQAMIDRYGGPYSNPPYGICKITDIVMKPNGMAAKVICSALPVATGRVQTTFVDPQRTKTTVHLIGYGDHDQPMILEIQSTSIYKSPDCGRVKPLPMPASQ